MSFRKRILRRGHRGTDQGIIENAFPGSDILQNGTAGLADSFLFKHI